MAIASAITIVKLAIIAALLPAEGFTFYASTFAASGFFASVASFGLVEGTPKKYTRWIARKYYDAVVRDLDSASGRISLRIGLLGLASIGGALVYTGEIISSIIIVTGVLTIALSVNAYSAVASILRGLDWLQFLACTAIARATLATVAASTAGYLAGWHAGLLAEGLTGIVLVGVLILFLRRQLSIAANATATTPSSQPIPSVDIVDAGGRWLFAAYLITGIPMSLDRWAITTLDTAHVASQYAFVAIWIIGAFTVSSIYIQKFGPDMIRYREASPKTQLLKPATSHTFLLASLLAAGSLSSFIIINSFFYEIFWVKYNLTTSVVLAVTVCTTLQVTPLLDWTLVALDKEKKVLFASFIFVFLTCTGFLLSGAFSWGTAGYLSAIAIGRLTQGIVLFSVILNSNRIH